MTENPRQTDKGSLPLELSAVQSYPSSNSWGIGMAGPCLRGKHGKGPIGKGRALAKPSVCCGTEIRM